MVLVDSITRRLVWPMPDTLSLWAPRQLQCMDLRRAPLSLSLLLRQRLVLLSLHPYLDPHKRLPRTSKQLLDLWLPRSAPASSARKHHGLNPSLLKLASTGTL
jgi:hypothetical protein